MKTFYTCKSGLEKTRPSKGCDELSPSQGRGLCCSPLGPQVLRTSKERTLLHLFFSTESSICINKDCNLGTSTPRSFSTSAALDSVVLFCKSSQVAERAISRAVKSTPGIWISSEQRAVESTQGIWISSEQRAAESTPGSLCSWDCSGPVVAVRQVERTVVVEACSLQQMEGPARAGCLTNQNRDPRGEPGRRMGM
ncbi:hypothetical protein F7725_002738, partial [Dissostichus mawsoni]